MNQVMSGDEVSRSFTETGKKENSDSCLHRSYLPKCSTTGLYPQALKIFALRQGLTYCLSSFQICDPCVLASQIAEIISMHPHTLHLWLKGKLFPCTLEHLLLVIIFVLFLYL